MKILVTGGTGFIGSRLALRCMENGDSVRVLGQENTPAEEENRKTIEEGGAEVVLASVVDRGGVFEATKGVDLIYHLAAAQHEAGVSDQVFWDVNVAGTKNILEASLENKVDRVIHGSTIGVYGSTKEEEIDEQSPLNPDNIYGITKLEGENFVRSFRNRIPVVIIRISETYGPGDRRLLKLFKAIKKNAFFMIGNGENLHHLIFIDDLIEGFLCAARDEKAVGETFVFAGKEFLTTNEMVGIIAEELGTKIRKIRAPLLPFLLLATLMEKGCRPIGIQPPLHPRRMDFFRKGFFFSKEKPKRILGFDPKVDFREGVRKTVQWYEEAGYL
ncbi:MAG: NAD-dependent epimerase/dehydratase family protein [candidate division Zixibacteria bacterium]|nr:NAD-dependent epimerase/dehydratase family protein [candidate division Zixibacteria bacterium]